jgi:hypothetical protein
LFNKVRFSTSRKAAEPVRFDLRDLDAYIERSRRVL